MKVSKAIETPMGTIQFQGELTPEEFDVVLSYGLMVLFSQDQIKTTFVTTPPKGDTTLQ